MSGFKAILNTFLDSTPRQWLHYHSEVFGFNFSSIKEFLAWLKATLRSRATLATGISAAGHTLLLILVFASQSPLAKEDGDKETIKLSEIDASTFEQRLSKGEITEITGVYYFTKLNEKEKKQNSLASLIKNLQSANRSHWQYKKIPLLEKSGGKKYDLAELRNAKIDWSELNETEKEQVDWEKNLNVHLAKYDGQFRNCYETALLTDSSLNAKVEFLLTVGRNQKVAKTQINIDGVGLPTSKSQLSTCLKGITAGIVLPESSDRLLGKKLKFFVVLNSWK